MVIAGPPSFGDAAEAGEILGVPLDPGTVHSLWTEN
jgi:hypothetical protein